MNKFSVVLLCCLALAGCQTSCDSCDTCDTCEQSVDKSSTSSLAPIATSAEAVKTRAQGDKAGTATVRNLQGDPIDMATMYAKQPTVLVFYRGGWCPYCNAHLAELVSVEPRLVAMGYQVLAISPDSPASMKATMDKGDFKYTLLSDSEMNLARSFGLAFRVDDATITKYATYGIDLEKASGFDHHALPVPAVYVIDKMGVIQFSHVDPDYKKRLSGDDLLAAAQKAAAK